MMDVLAFLVLWLSNWYDGCPCHNAQLTANDINSYQKRSRLRERLGGDCVMNSRRGPEFAVGAMMQFVRHLLDVSLAAIVSEIAQVGVNQDEIGIISQEFTRARRHFWFTMVVKHSYWSHQPWCFFGLAHHLEHIARSCAKRALRLRESLLRDRSRAIHWITKLLLFDTTVVRELQAFANGQPVDELKTLVVIVSMFRFAYTSEIVLWSLFIGFTAHSAIVTTCSEPLCF